MQHPMPDFSLKPKAIPFKWEEITGSGGVTWRAKIFGGWVFCQDSRVVFDNDGSTVSSVCFIPDPKHEWAIADDAG